jgi:glutamate--cysteine ligase
MITSKEHIIDYFKSGIKNSKNFKIGIEHEKFLFNINDNTRVDYSKIKQMFLLLQNLAGSQFMKKKILLH